MSLEGRRPHQLSLAAALEVETALAESACCLSDVAAQCLDPPWFHGHSVPMRMVFDQITPIEPVAQDIGSELSQPPKRSLVSNTQRSNAAGGWTSPVRSSVRGMRRSKTMNAWSTRVFDATGRR